MKRRKEDEVLDDEAAVDAPESAEATSGPDRPAGAEEEETGLAPVPEPVAATDTQTLESLRRERDELKDQLLRRRADFDNYRKRVARDRNLAAEEAAASLLAALIPTLDNLDRALETPGSEGSLREGVELIRRDLLSLLKSQGVTVQEPVGERFDPDRHQALSHEAVPGFADGTIVEVFRKGYLLGNRLLRPALVKVAKEAKDPLAEGPEA